MTYYVASKWLFKSKPREELDEDSADLDTLDEEWQSHVKTLPQQLTFADLYERAYFLANQRTLRRKVRLFFDANDEFVSEEYIESLLTEASDALEGSE